jgi:hypothetical protein
MMLIQTLTIQYLKVCTNFVRNSSTHPKRDYRYINPHNKTIRGLRPLTNEYYTYFKNKHINIDIPVKN